jgi:hypothetical protein
MKIVYSRRAIRDLEQIGAYHRAVANPDVAAAIAERSIHPTNALVGDSTMALDTDKIDDAILALLYLTLHDGYRAWKGFDGAGPAAKKA